MSALLEGSLSMSPPENTPDICNEIAELRKEQEMIRRLTSRHGGRLNLNRRVLLRVDGGAATRRVWPEDILMRLYPHLFKSFRGVMSVSTDRALDL